MNQSNPLIGNRDTVQLAKSLIEHRSDEQWATARMRVSGLILKHDGQSPSDLVEYYRQLSLGPTHEVISQAIYDLSNEGVIQWNPVRLKYVFTDDFRALIKSRTVAIPLTA